MSETQPAPVEQTAVGSAAVETQDTPPKTEDKVSYETHRRLLDEKKKAQAENAELKKAAAELSELKAKKKAEEEDKLRQKGEYEKLLQARDQELGQVRTELTGFKDRMRDAKKLSAFMAVAGGDVDSKWFGMVDLDKIAFKPDSEDVDEFSVNTAVETFKKSWPEAFKPKGSPLPTPTMPNGNGYITEAEWNKLSHKEMKKYKPEQIKWGH